MAVSYGKFEMPNKVSIKKESSDSTFAQFVVEPFERGYGHTLGNSLRRILLSSIESPGLLSFRIEGVDLEYQFIEGVVEDMTNIALNLKGALLRRLPSTEGDLIGRDSKILTTIVEIDQAELDANNGQVAVTLGRVIASSDYEIINPELHLFSVTVPFKRQIDIRVGMGRGYATSERHEIADRNVGEILIDTAFSPVRQVSYSVENCRVGQDTDFDRLVLEVTTDGRITPKEALTFSAQICIKQIEVFSRIEEKEISFVEVTRDSDSDDDEMLDKLCLRIDEIELSVRSANCLAGADIRTIAELVSIPERRMLEFRNFGKKSLNEIKAKLHEMGLGLGMDLSRFGIDPNNVRQSVTQITEERRALKESSLFDETGIR